MPLAPALFVFNAHNLLQVVNLSLDHNLIATLDKAALANLSNLNTVFLRNNPLRQIDPLAFQNLPQLKNLYLTNGRIQQLHPDVFQVSAIISLRMRLEL